MFLFKKKGNRINHRRHPLMIMYPKHEMKPVDD